MAVRTFLIGIAMHMALPKISVTTVAANPPLAMQLEQRLDSVEKALQKIAASHVSVSYR